ncbi:MAG: hypothetical protein ACPHGW_11165 [Pseudohongiellaceae bacterium]
MFVLDILPSRMALVVLCAVHGMAVLALTGKRRISEELAVSPRRFRRCLAGETRWHLENAAGRVTVLPPRPIFISELLIVLEFRISLTHKLRVRTSFVCICFLTVCRRANPAGCAAFCDFRIR